MHVVQQCHGVARLGTHQRACTFVYACTHHAVETLTEPFLAMKTLSKEQHVCSPTSLPSPFHALQDEVQRAWRAAPATWKALRIRTPASCSNAFHPPSSVAPCDVRLSATARTHGRHTDSSSQTECGGRSTALRQRARAVTVRLRLLNVIPPTTSTSPPTC